MKKLRQITEEFDSIPEDKDEINSTIQHRHFIHHMKMLPHKEEKE
jgi:hypothetical protein